MTPARSPRRAGAGRIPEPTRGSRRKQRNRERLIAAARSVMASKGVDTTTIAEITEEADLGFGTFYNHFDSKEEIVDAILTDGIENLGRGLDRLTEGIDDPARVLAISARHVLRMADADPVFAWFVMRMPDPGSKISEHLGPRALRDVRAGVEAGRFEVDDLAAVSMALVGIVTQGIRGRLDGTLDASSEQILASYVLRLLGIPADEAHALSGGELPPVDSSTDTPNDPKS